MLSLTFWYRFFSKSIYGNVNNDHMYKYTQFTVVTEQPRQCGFFSCVLLISFIYTSNSKCFLNYCLSVWNLGLLFVICCQTSILWFCRTTRLSIHQLLKTSELKTSLKPVADQAHFIWHPNYHCISWHLTCLYIHSRQLLMILNPFGHFIGLEDKH